MFFVEDILVERFLLLSYCHTCRCLKRLRGILMDSRLGEIVSSINFYNCYYINNSVNTYNDT